MKHFDPKIASDLFEKQIECAHYKLIEKRVFQLGNLFAVALKKLRISKTMRALQKVLSEMAQRIEKRRGLEGLLISNFCKIVIKTVSLCFDHKQLVKKLFKRLLSLKTKNYFFYYKRINEMPPKKTDTRGENVEKKKQNESTHFPHKGRKKRRKYFD